MTSIPLGSYQPQFSPNERCPKAATNCQDCYAYTVMHTCWADGAMYFVVYRGPWVKWAKERMGTKTP